MNRRRFDSCLGVPFTKSTGSVERDPRNCGVVAVLVVDGGPPLMAELVEPRDAPERWALPAGFVRVWKLHGSTNWRFADGSPPVVVRVGSGGGDGSVAIYPSDEKYDESRRVPFVVLMDRFRRALVEPETVTITTGFSFSDEHLNEMLFDAAVRHPRSEVLALCYEDIPGVVADRASNTSSGGRDRTIAPGASCT